MAEQPVNPYSVPLEELELATQVPLALQVQTVNPAPGAGMTSSDGWVGMRWMADGGGEGSLGAGTDCD